MTGSTPKGPAAGVGFACGGAECPTCGRVTEAIFGPCLGCCESFERTGKFLRRRRAVAIASGGDGPDTARTPTRSELPGANQSPATGSASPPARAPGAPPLEAKET